METTLNAPEPKKPEQTLSHPQHFPAVFQAFDLEKGIMYQPNELQALGVVIAPTGQLLRGGGGEPLKLQVLFFSGVTDSKKRALFDGDICKIGVKLYPDLPSLTEKWGVMRWVKDKFIIQIIGVRPNELFEVVAIEYQGNEYEHPELLKNL